MADKVEKPKKKAKPKKEERGVLAALPATRPERIGSRRAEPAAAQGASAPATARSAPAKPAAPKAAPAPATARSAPAKPAAAEAASARSAKKRAATKTASRTTTTPRPKAAAPHTFEPTQAAESAAKAAPPRPEAASRPRPVSEGAPGIGTGARPDERPRESARPSGVELASTAVKAAGEVAQLGITIGGHLLKRAVQRLPRM
jgi:hypothetical protein